MLESTLPPDAYGMDGTGRMDETGSVTQDAGFSLRIHGGGAHTGVVPEGFDDIHTHILDACPRARLTEDEMLEREVSRRRNQELERRARIFDAKRRTIGVDKDTLEQQCRDNEAKRRAEKVQAKVEDRQLLGVNKMLQMAENTNRQLRHETEKETKMYSLQNLHFEARREFDLNDPKAVIRAAPSRIGDDDPRCGPASMQQFNGEDLLKEERDRQQKLAMVHTLEQQIFEKEMLKRMGEGGDAEYAQQCQDVIDLRNEIEATEHGFRKEIMGKYQQGLKDKMTETSERKHAEAMSNQEHNDRELDFHSRDEFLNETRSNRRPDGQLSKDSYKGSNRDERVEVFGHQLAQCDDKAQRKAMDGYQDFHHNRNQELTRKQLVMMEREKQRMKKEMAMACVSHNHTMIATKQATAEFHGKDAHRNKVHPEYFEQFGVGSR
mmetsp:Transcript_30840/g.78079  ORF Transcript_30840/g.78079 Transcript_30840/m.78079 type:complete len:436 (+) Transcript_30840:97-1404(+)